MDSQSSPIPSLIALCSVIYLVYRIWPSATNYEKRLKTLLEDPSIENRLTVSKESEYPEQWLTGNDIFKLEQRAIFSKSWLYLSHRSRFTKAGDYHSFDVAGFPIFLILGKDGEVRAFHNVCRHRAYTVTQKECGSSAVLGCRYHGWSYNTKGQLIKAPQFDDVPGFNRAQNGLFTIRVFQSTAGFIFVNLGVDGSDEVRGAIALDDFARGRGAMAQPCWVEGQTLEGNFNWKIAVQAKQQFESASSMAGLAKIAQPSMFARIKEFFFGVGAEDSAFLLCPPNASFHMVQGTKHWYSLSFLPVTEQNTVIRYDLYCSQSKNSKSTSQEISHQLDVAVRRYIRELELQYQSHVKGSGNCIELHDSDPVRQMLQQLKSHSELEKLEGKEIHAAMKRSTTTAKFVQADQLCRELECPSGGFKDLTW